jgi:hypothetical protein
VIKYEGIDEELIELDEEDDELEPLIEVVELEELELLKLLELDDENNELELLLVDVGIELEALLEDKEGLGPTSPHAANTSIEVIRKDHFTDF